MPRDGNGDYTLPPLNPVQSGTTILSNWANSTMPDLGDAMTDSLSRSGQGGMLVAFKVVDGTLNTPAIGFQTEPSLGFYRPALGTIAFVSQSGETLRIRPSGNVSTAAAAPTNANDLTRKDYVDGLVNGLDSQNVKLTGDQSIAGEKTFTDNATFTGTITALENLTFVNDKRIQFGDDTTYLTGNSGADTINFITNAATALTLDAAQNATFAGDVDVSGGALNVTANNASARAAYFYSNVSTRTVPLVEIVDDNATGSAGPALKIQQDSGSIGIELDINGAGDGIHITKGGSSTSDGILVEHAGIGGYGVSATIAAMGGSAIAGEALSVGTNAGYFYSNLASRQQPVVEIINDNATGSGVALEIQSDQGLALNVTAGGATFAGLIEASDITLNKGDTNWSVQFGGPANSVGYSAGANPMFVNGSLGVNIQASGVTRLFVNGSGAVFSVVPSTTAAQGTAATALTRKDYVDQAIEDAIAGIGGSGLPVGMISPFAHELSDANWLYCNGQAVSRTTYSALFAAIGTTYGGGDFTTTFNLPDYRGKFLRSQDDGAGRDPNANVRTPAGTEAGGDNVGTNQTGALQTHQHGPAGGHQHAADGAHTHTRGTMEITGSLGVTDDQGRNATMARLTGAFFNGASSNGAGFSGTGGGQVTNSNFAASRTWSGATNSAGGHQHDAVADHQHAAAGSSTENRPINQYVRYYIYVGATTL